VSGQDTASRAGPASLDEFALIERHLAALGAARDDVILGVGDDAALVRPAAGRRPTVVMTSTTPGAGEDPAALARRSLAEPLARLAGRGARPAWATLALTLDAVEPAWVARFAAALGEEAARAGVAIIGGDTTRGPSRITMSVIGVENAAPARATG
jgi:thiamine-monophosphate kinase